MRRAAGQFRDLSHEHLIFVTPVDDRLVFVHVLLLGFRQSVEDDYSAYLANLVYFGFVSVTLEIDQIPDTSTPENVVAAANPLLKAEPVKQVAEVVETDVASDLPSRIRSRSSSYVPTHLI